MYLKGYLINKKDGSFYVGNFKNGKESGFGVRWFADGTIYEGEWKFAEQNGQGTLWNPDGSRYVGGWK